jgi:hypothetical protein
MLTSVQAAARLLAITLWSHPPRWITLAAPLPTTLRVKSSGVNNSENQTEEKTNDPSMF